MILCLHKLISFKKDKYVHKKYFYIVLWIKDEKKILQTANYATCAARNKYKAPEAKRPEFLYIRSEEIIC